jgi:hypothetical protein
MARNPAARKAAKAIRRKAVVAAKRKVEGVTSGLGGQVRQAARLPIMECRVSDGLFECGMGVVTLIRGASRAYQHIAFFMVDSFCLGVKNTFFRSLERHEAEHILEGMESSDPASFIAPAEARKLLHDIVAWAGNNGFQPHIDYACMELLFGDVVPAETDYTSRLGYDGEVLYVPGPTETPAQVQRRMRTVRSRVGNTAADRSILALASVLGSEMELAMDDEE